MFNIKTEYGNFGRFKDLLMYMEEENKEYVNVDVSYYGLNIGMFMTKEELKKYIKDGKLI